MLNKNEHDRKDMFRKKHYNLHKNMKILSLRKIIMSLDINYGAWYRFVFYGDNSLSLNSVEKLDLQIIEELKKAKNEINNFLEEDNN